MSKTGSYLSFPDTYFIFESLDFVNKETNWISRLHQNYVVKVSSTNSNFSEHLLLVNYSNPRSTNKEKLRISTDSHSQLTG